MSTESRPVIRTPAGHGKPGMRYFGNTRKGCIAVDGDTDNTVKGEDTTLTDCNIIIRRNDLPYGRDSRGTKHA